MPLPSAALSPTRPPAHEGLVVSEDIIVEIVRPGSGDPGPDGEVGEVVVTLLDPRRPLMRFARRP